MNTPQTNHQKSYQDSLQLNDEKKHLVVYGLAGTGKSHYLTQLIEGEIQKREIKRSEFLVFTFDRKLRQNYCEKSETFNQTNTYTVHAFCFSVLKSLELLPKQFLGIKTVDNNQKLTGKEYDKLIKRFLQIEDETLCSIPFVNRIKMIVCDEVQDFREDYIQVIQKIKKVACSPKIIIAGDVHQKIYGFQDKHHKCKLSEVLINPKILFGNTT